MKKFLLGLMLVGAIFASYGCGEKSKEEKAKDGIENAKDSAVDAKDAAAKKLDEINK